MKKKYTWRILGLLACLLFGLVNVSCNKDKDEITEEQARIVLANAEVVMDNVSQIYEASETVEEMAQHLDEIKAMENVEDAWEDNNSIFIKIKEGGIVSYNYYPKLEFDNGTYDEMKLIKNTKDNNVCEKKKACIVIQWIDDEGMIDNYYLGLLTSSIPSDLSNNNYDYTIIRGDEFTLDFLCNKLPEYGVIILATHGNYENGVHWITTGERFNNITRGMNIYYSLWKKDSLRVGCSNEIFHGNKVTKYYLDVSEKYLQEHMREFPNNSLMFLNTCKILEGNHNMWKILQNKNLGCLLGYDNSLHAGIGYNAVESIMHSMLRQGATASEAYQAVPAGWRHDNTTGANLLLCPANSDIALVERSDDEGDWVDLGLPSGLLWATRNVGASSPEDYGDYFAWGETTPKTVYSWSTYRYCYGGNSHQLTKYCNKSDYGYNGFTDNLTILQPGDDAATANYGGRTPTKEEWQELIDNTTSQWTTINGVNGQCFIGFNGNKIFLPASGYRGTSLHSVSIFGTYWSSSLQTNITSYAWGINFSMGSNPFMNYGQRFDGCSVRAVRSAR